IADSRLVRGLGELASTELAAPCRPSTTPSGTTSSAATLRATKAPRPSSNVRPRAAGHPATPAARPRAWSGRGRAGAAATHSAAGAASSRRSGATASSKRGRAGSACTRPRSGNRAPTPTPPWTPCRPSPRPSTHA
ncbi:hypothetical protein M885DRAFT_613405, partial [Pelagophyceae sp. CCMP2097]